MIKPLICRTIAVKKGFEPLVPVSQYTCFPNMLLQPLGHFTKNTISHQLLSLRSADSGLDTPQYYMRDPSGVLEVGMGFEPMHPFQSLLV